MIVPGDLTEAVLLAADRAGMGVSITVFAPEGARIVHVSDAAVRIMGRTRDEMVGRSPVEFMAPEERERSAQVVKERAAGRPATLAEYNVMRSDGTRVPVRAISAHLTIDGLQAAVGFVWDISVEREAERKRTAEAERLARVVASAPDGIVLVRGASILSVNAAGARILGFDDAAALTGRSLIELVVPEDVPLMLRRMQAAAAGEAQTPQVYRVRRKDGTVSSAEVSSIPFEHEGKPALLAFVRDVSERAQLEEQLARAERLASLSTLAAGLAHEINNPLTAAMLQLDVIEQQLDAALDLETRRPITDRIRELRHLHDRLAETVRDFASFARTGDEKTEEVDLGAVIAAVERMLGPLVRRAGSYVLELPQLPKVRANASRIEQVFVNLMLNAVQAMPDGRESNEIRLTGRVVSDGRVCIEISDNGVGITPANLRRVFDPFFTTKPVGVGTGLGLTVCHNIVSSYGGEIEVHSSAGQGCTMRVLLPVATAVAPQRGRPRVMIIDDEPHLTATLSLLLEERHEVTATTQSEHAVRILLDGAPVDVVICDLMMPDPNGMEVFRRVTERRPELKDRFIFMTGGVYTSATERFLESCSASRVEKPFDADAVEALIARIAAQG